MIRWLRRGGCRRMTLVTMSALAVLGCSVDDRSDADTPSSSEVDLDREPSEVEHRSEVEEVADPAARARIELLTQDATSNIVRAADFLADQMQFRFVADISFDVLQRDGRMLEFGSRREITIRRPDRFRMREVRRDGESRTVTFDGSAISIDLPWHQAFVQIERPGTLYAALDHLMTDLGAPVPLANLLSENLAAPLENQIASGYYVKTEELAGRSCEHLTFRLPDVDVQLWVEEGDRPLIARIVISYKHAEGNPQFRATLRDWDLGIDTPDSLFHFEPATGSERLSVGSLRGGTTPGGEQTE